MQETEMYVRFWGVRGSVPAPLTPAQVEQKIVQSLLWAHTHENRPPISGYGEMLTWARENLPFPLRSTFGGNTTCVELRCDDELIIFDMGTGLRELGMAHMGETLRNKGLHATVLQSHVHWDHIQGYPFMPQVYMPRKHFDNHFKFYGGKDWDLTLEEALRLQMSDPSFPVEHRELEKTALQMTFDTVWDGRELTIPGAKGEIRVLCHKLNHPQDTFGYRVEYKGKSVTFCTDHEPYALGVPRPLLALAQKTDVFITDCQYTAHEYEGRDGKVQKLGWGHSYPEYIAQVAQEAGVGMVVTTHHDPSATDAHVLDIAQQVDTLAKRPAKAAFEGMLIRL